MIIGITGHTKGIGKAISNALSNHTIIGCSRSNGYDIDNVDSIINAVVDCDVFINNAYNGYKQTELLEKLCDLWKNTNKLIINIGSTVTDYPRTEKHLDHLQWDYRDHKRSLRDTFRKLAKQTDSCRLVLISPGSTDTDMVKHHNCAKLNPDEVARVVMYAMHNTFVKEFVLYV